MQQRADGLLLVNGFPELDDNLHDIIPSQGLPSCEVRGRNSHGRSNTRAGEAVRSTSKCSTNTEAGKTLLHVNMSDDRVVLEDS